MKYKIGDEVQVTKKAIAWYAKHVGTYLSAGDAWNALLPTTSFEEHTLWLLAYRRPVDLKGVVVGFGLDCYLVALRIEAGWHFLDIQTFLEQKDLRRRVK